MKSIMSERSTAILSGVAGVMGVLMIIESFHINNGPPLDSPDTLFLAYATSHRLRVLWGAWLQAVGPALIIVFALSLVSLSKAFGRVSGVLTVFGAAVLMMTSLLEVTCYIGGLFTNPSELPRIANTLGYAVQHLYFSVAAPALFLPLGLMLLGSSVLPRIFAWLALLLGVSFVVLGLLYIGQLVLPLGVTSFAAVQALWWLLASFALMFRSGRIARDGAGTI